MKKISLLPLLFLAIVACKNINGRDVKKTDEVAKDSANYTTISWADSVQDLGTLPMGEKAEIKFHFTNSGNKPLFIISAVPGCGCTVADYPKDAIAPGKSGDILATFDTNKGHEGTFDKVVTVTANTKGTNIHQVSFHGVIAKSDKKK